MNKQIKHSKYRSIKIQVGKNQKHPSIKLIIKVISETIFSVVKKKKK